MTQPTDLDRIRGAALDRIGSAKRKFLMLLAITGMIEALFLGLVFYVADLQDQLHLLVMCSSFLVYATLGMCMFALGGYVNLSTQRILRSIELTEAREADQPRA